MGEIADYHDPDHTGGEENVYGNPPDTSGLVEVHFVLPSKLDGLGRPVEGKTTTITMTHVPRKGDGVVPKFDGRNDAMHYVVDHVIWYPQEAALATFCYLKEA